MSRIVDESFLALPVESMVHDNQQSYYDAINESTKNTDCEIFIDYMLAEIHAALKVYQYKDAMSGGVSDGVSGGVNNILKYIQMNPNSRANGIAEALQIPLRSVERYLSQLKRDWKVEFRGAPRNGGYFFKGWNCGIALKKWPFFCVGRAVVNLWTVTASIPKRTVIL